MYNFHSPCRSLAIRWNLSLWKNCCQRRAFASHRAGWWSRSALAKGIWKSDNGRRWLPQITSQDDEGLLEKVFLPQMMLKRLRLIMNTKQELKKMTKEVISPCKNAHDILTVTTQVARRNCSFMWAKRI